MHLREVEILNQSSHLVGLGTLNIVYLVVKTLIGLTDTFNSVLQPQHCLSNLIRRLAFLRCTVLLRIWSVVHCAGCGDLSPTVIRLFSKWKRASTMVCISCCYMKAERTAESENVSAFPMSRYVQRRIVSGKDIGSVERFLQLSCEVHHLWICIS